MTPKEFKAWFDGFTEAMEKAPDDKQWEKIKARVSEIDGDPVSYPVYVDRYWPSYPTYPQPYLWGATWLSNSASGSTLSASNDLRYTERLQNAGYSGDGNIAEKFDSLSAMYAAGKADAASMSA